MNWEELKEEQSYHDQDFRANHEMMFEIDKNLKDVKDLKNVEGDLEMPVDEKISFGMVRDFDIETHIFKSNFHNVNFEYFNEL